MKNITYRFLLSMAAFVVLLPACKKEQIAPFHQDVAFIKYYGHVLDQSGTDVKAVQGEEGLNYYILGSTYSFSENGKYRDFYFVKTDSLGNEMWSFKYGNDTKDQIPDAQVAVEPSEGYDYDEIGRRIVVLADGSGFLLAGTRQRIEKDENGLDVAKEKRIVLYLVDLDGVLVQATVLRYGDIANAVSRFDIFSDELADIKQLLDTDGTTGLGYVLTGKTTNVDTLKPEYNDGNNKDLDKYDVYTARLEPDLSIRWQRAYGFIREDEGASVEITDKGYIVVGTTNIREGNIFQQDFIFITYKEASGNILNQHNFGGIEYEVRAVSSCYDSLNHIMTAFGHVEPQVNNGSSQDGNLMIIQVDSDLEDPSNGNVLPTFIPQNYANSEAASIHLLPNDAGFILSATSDRSTLVGGNGSQSLIPSRDIHVLKLNKDLVLEDPIKDQALFGYIKEDEAGSIVPIITTFSGSTATEIKSFVFTGTFNVGTNYMMGLVKVNSDLSFDPDGVEDQQ